MAIFAGIIDDARLYQSLRLPNVNAGILPLALVWCVSRGLWVLASHRVAHRYSELHPTDGFAWVYKFWLGIVMRIGAYLSAVLAKCEVRPTTDIAPGVFLSNRGHIVLGARSVGSGTIVHERVTVGMSLMGKQLPTIGRNVWIGPDCVIHGALTIGDGATLLPRTVLTKSIPSGSVVQGNPARIVRREFENSRLRNSLSTDSASLMDAGRGN